MIEFKQAKHKAMLSYAVIRKNEKHADVKQELERTANMLRLCVCGAAVTLVGGMILGACMVVMVG